MEVILIEEVSELGYPGDILKVKDGYGRNYLLPKKLAVRKTQRSMERLKEQMANFEERIKNRKLHYEEIKGKLETLEGLEIIVRASKEGKIYGSVTAEMIASELKEKHEIAVEKKKVVVRKVIKTVDVYEIDIVLDKTLKVPLTLTVKALED